MKNEIAAQPRWIKPKGDTTPACGSIDPNGNRTVNDEFRECFTEADAKLIVKAVNSYSAMKEALEAIYAGVSDQQRSKSKTGMYSTDIAAVSMFYGTIAKIEAALKLAGEK